jgi:NitT/TauT family transport system permease protein
MNLLRSRHHTKKQDSQQQVPKKLGRKVDLEDLANIILFIAAFIGIWQLVFILGIWPKVSMPSPAMVAESFASLLQNLTLIASIGMTIYRLIIGFAISIAIGITIGLAMVKFPSFGKTMSSFAVGL